MIHSLPKNKLLSLFLILFFVLNVFTCCFAQDALNEKKEDIELQRNQLKKRISALKLKEKKETKKLFENKLKLDQTQHSLATNEKKYDKAKIDVINLQNKLDTLQDEHRKHLSYTSKRIVTMFKYKRNGYIEFLLNAKDINTFIDRLYFENIIIAHDKQKLKTTRAKAREIAALRNQLDDKKKFLAGSIATMHKQEKEIQLAISRNEELIEKLKTDLATWERAEKDLAKQSKAISQMINKEIKKTEKEGVSIAVVGGFIKPVQGRISSYFGYRIHPIFKRKIFHSGLDIAAPSGTAVKATNAGRVIFVGWYNGYGRVIIVDHGKINGIPTTSLYAHLSAALVKQGTNVEKGKTIGKVGTTGYSTGPHLHFEIRQNGNPVDPLRFIR